MLDHVEQGHRNLIMEKNYGDMKEWWKRYFDFYESPMKPGDAAWIRIQHSKIETGVGK